VKGWGAAIPAWSQDIDMPAIATMARQAQPGLLIVDRTVHGPYENYQTPEQRVPDKQLDRPWESCITLGNAWGYVPNDELKTSAKVIHQLIEVVAKGGSLLLGVGPTPQGTLPEPVVQRLTEIGSWLKVNGEAIYNTRPIQGYQSGNVYFVQSNHSKSVYALALLDENSPVPATIEWTINVPAKGSKIKLLSTGATVKYTVKDEKVIISVPPVVQKTKGNPALAFEFIVAAD
jgi:alpha-L-fucosidase